MQHMYAAIFAGSVTVLLAVAILYFDYGFWHERYHRTDTVEVVLSQEKNSNAVTESPGEMVEGFFKEVSKRVKEIGVSGEEVFDGKDVYRKDEGAQQ